MKKRLKRAQAFLSFLKIIQLLTALASFNKQLNQHRALITKWAKETDDKDFPYQNAE